LHAWERRRGEREKERKRENLESNVFKLFVYTLLLYILRVRGEGIEGEREKNFWRATFLTFLCERLDVLTFLCRKNVLCSQFYVILCRRFLRFDFYYAVKMCYVVNLMLFLFLHMRGEGKGGERERFLFYDSCTHGGEKRVESCCYTFLPPKKILLAK
jgi:hypothetical protein